MHINLSRANKPASSLAGGTFLGSPAAPQGSQSPTAEADRRPAACPRPWGAGPRPEQQAALRGRPRVTSSLGSRTCWTSAVTGQPRGRTSLNLLPTTHVN